MNAGWYSVLDSRTCYSLQACRRDHPGRWPARGRWSILETKKEKREKMIIVYTIESFLLCTFGHFPSNPHFPHLWGRSKKHGGMGLSDDSDCFPQAEGSEGLRETLLWATRRVKAFYPPGWGALPGGYMQSGRGTDTQTDNSAQSNPAQFVDIQLYTNVHCLE